MQKIWKQCYATFMLLILFTAAFLLSGCGDSSQSSVSMGQENISGETGDPEADDLHYRITERMIPDPEEIFAADPKNRDEGLFLTPVDSIASDGKLYYLYHITRMEDEIPCFYEDYLCVLEPPYEQWTCNVLPSDCWPTDNYYYLQGIAGVSAEGIYFFIAHNMYNENGSSYPIRQLGFYGWDGNAEIFEQLSLDDDPMRETSLYVIDENMYSIFGHGFTSYNKQLKPVQEKNLEGWISGCFPYDSEMLWYGFDSEQNLTVWDEPGGKKLFSLGDMVGIYSEFCLNRALTGEFVLADVSGIWTGVGDAPLKKILSFAEKGYTLEEILLLIPEEDGSLSLVVSFEGKLYMLNAEQTESAEKQEITLVSYGSGVLENVAAAFNRRSDQYYVTLVDPGDAPDREAYLQNLQMEMTAGRGPDLVSPWIIGFDESGANGYLEPLDDVIEDPSEYWSACLESGRSDGVLYCVPYCVSLSFLVASEALAGDLESWNLEQMMTAVRNSPAETLEVNMDGMDIVLRYGLMTPDNPQFIDYEAGISHLTEQPFLEFLEFAKDYSDELYYTTADPRNYYVEAADYYREGRIAVHHLTLNTPGDLLFATACFQDQEALIGWPSAQGRGVSMNASSLCLNANSSCKEGAKEFLCYLVSAEGQLRFVQNYSNMDDDIVFSCRMDVTEEALNAYQENPSVKKNSFTRKTWGVDYTIAPLNEEQIAQFWALFEDAKPEFSWPSEIYDMACEELAPYFAGDCTAEDAAAKLDNRMQLYLDENK